MRTISTWLGGLLMLTLVSPALAGITVTSYSTVALTNAWAPVGGTQYFERQELLNVSPAFAQTSGDWMGTNAGGSTNTWHYVGSAEIISTTTFDSNKFTVATAGSFGYEITTTADFVDPRSSTVFTPGAAASYNGFFTADVPVAYSMNGQLNQRSRVQLNSVGGGVGIVFDQSNPTPNPISLDLTGTLPPGQYRILINASLGASNLPNGVNNYARSGSFQDVVFTVQVPEPCMSVIYMAITAIATARRKQCASAH
jgi:hypothetical protein